MMTSAPIARVNLGLFWFAQLAAVLILTAVAWFLPSLTPITPHPEAQLPILAVGVASLPLVLLLGRWLGLRQSRPDVQLHEIPGLSGEHARPTAAPPVRWLILLALAEFPAVLGVPLVMFGGEPLYAVGLGAASCLILLVYRPRG